MGDREFPAEPFGGGGVRLARLEQPPDDIVLRELLPGLDEVLARSDRPDRGLLAATLSLGLDRIGAP